MYMYIIIDQKEIVNDIQGNLYDYHLRQYIQVAKVTRLLNLCCENF
jgi:hypothetical protein